MNLAHRRLEDFLKFCEAEAPKLYQDLIDRAIGGHSSFEKIITSTQVMQRGSKGEEEQSGGEEFGLLFILFKGMQRVYDERAQESPSVACGHAISTG